MEVLCTRLVLADQHPYRLFANQQTWVDPSTSLLRLSVHAVTCSPTLPSDEDAKVRGTASRSSPIRCSEVMKCRITAERVRRRLGFGPISLR